MDRNGSGTVESAEFERALDKMGIKVSHSAVEAMMREMDDNRFGAPGDLQGFELGCRA